MEQSAMDQLSGLDLPSTSGAANSKVEKTSNDIFGSFLSSISKTANPGGAVSHPSETRKPQKDAKTGKDLSGWYQLFAELDPLSNPDAIPSKADAPTNSLAA